MLVATALASCFGTPKPKTPDLSSNQVTTAATIVTTLKTDKTTVNIPGGLNLEAETIGSTIYKVNFYSGTTLINTDTSYPYSYIVNLTSVNNGNKTFSAKAYDSLGNIITSNNINISVNIPTLNSLPSSVALPSVVSLSMSESINNIAPTKVEFYRDDVLLATDTVKPFSENIFMNSGYNGVRKFFAKVYNASGFIYQTNMTSVNVAIPESVQSVLLSSDVYLLNKSGVATLSASLSNINARKVEFYNGNTLIFSDETAPFSANVNLTSINNGKMSYFAKIYDISGKIATSNFIDINIDIPISLGNTLELFSDYSNVSSVKTINLNTKVAGLMPKKVEFYSGSTLIHTDTTSPFSCPINLTSSNNGIKSFSAKSYDSAGVLVTSNIVKIEVIIDGILPAVSITGSTNIVKNSSILYLTANATDNAGIEKVEFYRNNILIGTDNTSPYNNSIFIDSGLNGNQVFTAKAYDSSGNTKTSLSYVVSVDIFIPDSVQPVVYLAVTSENIKLAGLYALTAIATDNVGIKKVEFYSNSTLLCTDAVLPYTCSLNLSKSNNGIKIFKAKAYDNAGNVSLVSEISVNISIGILEEYDLSVSGLEYPFVEKNSEFELNAGGFPSNSVYTWTINNETFTGSSVKYTYTQEPINKEIKLKATTPTGYVREVVETISILPKISEISQDLSLRGKDTLTFDLGTLPVGFAVEWDFGDGTVGAGSRITHTYGKIGTYPVQYRIIDQRTAITAFTRNLATSTNDVILLGDTWVTRWEPKLKAKFTFKNDSGVKSPVGVVKYINSEYKPYKLTFDASETILGSTLAGIKKYTWDFGDGTPKEEGKIKEHSFYAGAYIVTLTVEDNYGQTDTYRAYIVAKNESQFTSMYFRYPTLNTNIPEPERNTTLSSSEYGVNSKESMPYVVYYNGYDTAFANVKTPIVYTKTSPNPLIDQKYMYCDIVAHLHKEGGVIPTVSNVNGLYQGANGINNVNPSMNDWCIGFNTASASTNNALKAVWDRNEYTTDFRYVNGDIARHVLTYNAFAGLRVPRLLISIVPDRFLDGEKTSPYLEEESIVHNRKTEMISRISVREGDIKNGSISIKVPVYAVDYGNKLQTKANGYFKAKFTDETLSSDCGDCVMVNGKAYININVDLVKYGLSEQNATQSVDLSRIITYANSSCGYDDSSWVADGIGNISLDGCATIATSSEKPIIDAGSIYSQDIKVSAKPTELNVIEKDLANKIVLGTTDAERRKFETSTQNIDWETVKIVISILPVAGDASDLLGEAYKQYFTNDEVDIVLATLAAAGLLADTSSIAVMVSTPMGIIPGVAALIVDPLNGFKAAYKLSKKNNGMFRRILLEELSGVTSGLSVFDLKNQGLRIIDTYKTAGSFVFKSDCGILGMNCFGNYENIADQLKTGFNYADKSSLDQMDQMIQGARSKNIDVVCLLDIASQFQYSPDFTLQDMAITMFGQEINTVLRAIQSKSQNCTRKDGQLKRETVASKRYDYDDDEAELLTPHHIIPLNDYRASNCVENNINMCSEMRTWYKALFPGTDTLNAGINGVLLPSPNMLRKFENETKKRPPTKNDLSKFCTRYPDAVAHIQGVDGVHSLYIYKYIYGKMKVWKDDTQLSQGAFQANVQGFLSEVGRAFLEIDESSSINNEVREIIDKAENNKTPPANSFKLFCQ